MVPGQNLAAHFHLPELLLSHPSKTLQPFVLRYHSHTMTALILSRQTSCFFLRNVDTETPTVNHVKAQQPQSWSGTWTFPHRIVGCHLRAAHSRSPRAFLTYILILLPILTVLSLYRKSVWADSIAIIRSRV